MTPFPWLSAVVTLPLVGALATWALPQRLAHGGRKVALAASVLTLVLVVLLAARFDGAASGVQLAETYRWIPQLGVSWAVGMTGISLVMLALTAVLTPVCLLASWRDPLVLAREGDGRARSERSYHALLLVLEAMMLAAFAARDLFVFYVLFEAMLVPMYFVIGGFGGARRRQAAVKFLLYNLLGGLLMLVAVIGAYVAGPGGPDGFLIDRLTGLDAGTGTVRWLFLGFFVAFAIKAPLWPLHTWLPDALQETPPGAGVLLTAVMDKIGTFGMLTLCLPLFPEAARWAAPVICGLAVVSVLYGALLAIGQHDLKRLIAYASVSHFGFIVLGVFAMTAPGQDGAVLYMVNHGFATAALFLVAGMVMARRGSARLEDYGGWQRATPLLAGAFLVAGLANLSLPGLSTFVSEFLVLVGSFARYRAAGVLATVGIVLAALYVLLAYQKMFTGPRRDIEQLDLPPRDMTPREALVVGPLVTLLVVLGFAPGPVLDVLRPAVRVTMQQAGVVDPQPAVTAARGEKVGR